MVQKLLQAKPWHMFISETMSKIYKFYKYHNINNYQDIIIDNCLDMLNKIIIVIIITANPGSNMERPYRCSLEPRLESRETPRCLLHNKMLYNNCVINLLKKSYIICASILENHRYVN